MSKMYIYFDLLMKQIGKIIYFFFLRLRVAGPHNVESLLFSFIPQNHALLEEGKIKKVH